MDATDQSQGEVAFGKLMAAIRGGTYRPGDRLRETEVADRLSLSRTPVREALRRLEAEGIVEHRPRLGAVIRTLSYSEVVDLYEMRVVLERTAAGMAAKHAHAAEVDDLDALTDEIEAAVGDPSRAAAINQDFHRHLTMSARNRFLGDASRALNNALLLLGPTTLADAARIAVVCDEHRALTAAIREGDAQRAGDVAEGHLRTSLARRLKVLRG